MTVAADFFVDGFPALDVAGQFESGLVFGDDLGAVGVGFLAEEFDGERLDLGIGMIQEGLFLVAVEFGTADDFGFDRGEELLETRDGGRELIDGLFADGGGECSPRIIEERPDGIIFVECDQCGDRGRLKSGRGLGCEELRKNGTGDGMVGELEEREGHGPFTVGEVGVPGTGDCLREKIFDGRAGGGGDFGRSQD